VDGLIRDARAEHLRLVLLWFGSWKNTWSSYAPDWVKRDFERFPRVQLQNGSGTERLSPFSEANRIADARSFAALMRRIKETDSDSHTVIMVQVENPLFIPEAAGDAQSAANVFYAIGNHRAIGFSPFAIDSMDASTTAGSGLNITFSTDRPGPPIVDLATVEEGRFVDGRWVCGRVLAGDDTGQGNSVSLRSGTTGMLRVAWKNRLTAAAWRSTAARQSAVDSNCQSS
jgi:beta-galactosidase GanA